MGHAESKERLLFIDIVKHMINGRGIKVTNKQLTQFFQFVQEQCPWFPEQGTVNIETWQKVGQTLQVYYNHFGPEKVPVDTFTLWNLIRESLAPLPEGQKNPYKYPPDVSETTPLLSPKSFAEEAEVVGAAMKDCNIYDSDSEEEVNKSKGKSKPILLKDSTHDEELTPADQDDLDAAAYDYERRKYDLGAFPVREENLTKPQSRSFRALGLPPLASQNSSSQSKKLGKGVTNIKGPPPPPPPFNKIQKEIIKSF